MLSVRATGEQKWRRIVESSKESVWMQVLETQGKKKGPKKATLSEFGQTIAQRVRQGSLLFPYGVDESGRSVKAKRTDSKGIFYPFSSNSRKYTR